LLDLLSGDPEGDHTVNRRPLPQVFPLIFDGVEKFSTKMFEVKTFQRENKNNNKLPALLYLNFNFLSKAFSTILDK